MGGPGRSPCWRTPKECKVLTAPLLATEERTTDQQVYLVFLFTARRQGQNISHLFGFFLDPVRLFYVW